jgi:hypothetical protein
MNFHQKITRAFALSVVTLLPMTEAAQAERFAAGQSEAFWLDGTSYDRYIIGLDYFRGYDFYRKEMHFELSLPQTPEFRGQAQSLLSEFLNERLASDLDDRESHAFRRMLDTIATDGGFSVEDLMSDIGLSDGDVESLDYKAYRWRMLFPRLSFLEIAQSDSIYEGSTIVRRGFSDLEEANLNLLEARERYPNEPMFRVPYLDESDLREGRRNYASVVAGVLRDLFEGEDRGWARRASRVPYNDMSMLQFAAFFIYPNEYSWTGAQISDEARRLNEDMPQYFDEAVSRGYGCNGVCLDDFHVRFHEMLEHYNRRGPAIRPPSLVIDDPRFAPQSP